MCNGLINESIEKIDGNRGLDDEGGKEIEEGFRRKIKRERKGNGKNGEIGREVMRVKIREEIGRERRKSEDGGIIIKGGKREIEKIEEEIKIDRNSEVKVGIRNLGEGFRMIDKKRWKKEIDEEEKINGKR